MDGYFNIQVAMWNLNNGQHDSFIILNLLNGLQPQLELLYSVSVINMSHHDKNIFIII